MLSGGDEDPASVLGAVLDLLTASGRKMRAMLTRALTGRGPMTCCSMGIHVHAVLGKDVPWGQTGVEFLAGLSGIVAEGGIQQLSVPPFSDHGNGGPSLQTLFLPENSSENEFQATFGAVGGIVEGRHFQLEASCDCLEEIIGAIKLTNGKGKKCRVTVNNAAPVSAKVLSNITKLVADAGVDILVFEVLENENAQGDLDKILMVTRNINVSGFPMASKIGIRFGNIAHDNEKDDGESKRNAAIHDLFSRALSQGIIHFDTCPLNVSAISPMSLLKLLRNAGVESRFNIPDILPP